MTDYLIHHGVKGMHWGVRRYQPYASGAAKKGKEIGKAKGIIDKQKAAYDYKHGAYQRSKTMSDEELKKANARYVAEQNYRQNVKRDIQDSRGVARSTVSKWGNQTVNRIISGTAAAAGGAAVALILSNVGKIKKK